MKAIVITTPGGPEVLQLQEYPTPVPGDQEVLIRVAAAGLNRADVSQRKGNYPPPPGVIQDIPGMELAGEVAACGPGVTLWKPGDKVCALIGGGAYATYAVAKEGVCLPVPENLSLAEAASLPEAIATVWLNVFQRGRLKAGETLLVHGGSSGIGMAAIQMARDFGAKTYVTVGADEKGEACLQYGATGYVNYKKQDFKEALTNTGIDVILDMVGGEYLDKNLHIINPEGRIVYINAMGGNMAPLNISRMMQKRVSITGTTLRPRDYAFKKALFQEILEKVWPLVTNGSYKPAVYATFPLAEASKAHALMETSQHIGKIILKNE